MLPLAGAAQQQHKNLAGGDTVNIQAPAATGIGYVGELLTCDTGTWENETTFTYQWKYDGLVIGAATNPTYTVDYAFHGTELTCEVTSNGVTAVSNPIHHWIPTDGNGVEAWYTPADVGTMTLSGSDITVINDKSGNAHHLTADVGLEAVYEASSTIDSNLPGIVLLEDTQMGDTQSLTMNSWIMCGAYKDGVDAAWDHSPTLFRSKENVAAIRIMAEVGTDLWRTVSTAATESFNNGDTNADATALPWPKQIRRFEFTSTTGIIEVLYANNAGQNGFEGTVFELVIPKATATSDELKQIEGYLAHVNAVTLVDGHPYKFNPPTLGYTPPVDPTTIITGCPASPVAVGSNITLVGVTTLPDPVRHVWDRLLPFPSGTALSYTDTYGPYQETLYATNFEYRYRAIEQITVPGGGGQPSADRKTALLNRGQPGTSLPTRIGYGAAATGGQNYVTVNNLSELETQANISNNYVILGSGMSGAYTISGRMNFNADNVTIDGRDAPNAYIYNPGIQNGVDNNGDPKYFSTAILRGENMILHCLTFTANPSLQITALNINNTRHSWFDHITFVNHENDDSFSIGTSSSGQYVSDVTFTNCYTDLSDFSGFNYEGRSQHLAAGRLGRVTYAFNRVGAEQRAPKNDGAGHIHFFNNFVSGVIYAKTKVDDTNVSGAPRIWIDSESNVYANYSGSGNNKAEQAEGSRGEIYTDGLSDYSGEFVQAGRVYNPGDPQYIQPNLPYTYEKLTTQQVRDTIGTYTGDYSAITYEPAGSTGDTIVDGVVQEATCTYTTVGGVDRYQSVLSSQYRTGYGKDTTGAPLSNGVPVLSKVVTNTNTSGAGSFKDAVQTDNAYITFDPNMFPEGQTVYITHSSGMNIGDNITIDARRAGVVLTKTAGSQFQLLRMTGAGNCIILSLKCDGQNRSGKCTPFFCREGANYWFDHCSFSDWGEDAIVVGNSDSSTCAHKVTVTNCTINGGSKGMTIDIDNQEPHDAGRGGYVTLYQNEFNALDRNVRNTGGTFVHYVNNYTHGWVSSPNDCVNNGNKLSTGGGPGSNVDAWTYSENNYYGNPDPSAQGASYYAERAPNSNKQSVDGSQYIYIGGSFYDTNILDGGVAHQGTDDQGQVVDRGGTWYGPLSAVRGPADWGYTIPSIAAGSAVKAIVEAEAGSDNYITWE